MYYKAGQVLLQRGGNGEGGGEGGIAKLDKLYY